MIQSLDVSSGNIARMDTHKTFKIIVRNALILYAYDISKLPAGIRLGDNCLFTFLYAENAV